MWLPDLEIDGGLSNLKNSCEEHLQGQYRIEVIDLLQNPALAKGTRSSPSHALVRKTPRAHKENHRGSLKQGTRSC